MMAYELRMALPELESFPRTAGMLAEFDDVELLHHHLERVAISCGFLDPRNRSVLCSGCVGCLPVRD